jgi:hypothetical protein
MTKTYTNEELIAMVIKEAKKAGLRVRRHYSGRAMFGANCIGIVGELDECIYVGKKIEKKTGKSIAWDNMALEYIVYFPSISDEREGA